MSSTTAPDSAMLDLQRRVDKILGAPAPSQSHEELSDPQNLAPALSSQLSLSPRSSLSSVSPPVSPYDPPPPLPPTYEQAFMTSHKRSPNGHSPVKRTGLSLKGIIDANLVPGHRRTNQDSVGSDQG